MVDREDTCDMCIGNKHSSEIICSVVGERVSRTVFCCLDTRSGEAWVAASRKIVTFGDGNMSLMIRLTVVTTPRWRRL